MIETESSLSPGDIIIAPPRMQDNRFTKTVILLTHFKQGATFGLCLNKISNHTVADLSPEIDAELPSDVPLYWGGPVNPHTIWMLHDTDWQVDASIQINEHWAMTSHVSMFHHLSDGDRPKNFIMTFGFCGWSAGQLDAEINGNPPWTVESSWLLWRRPEPKILEVDSSELWRIATEQSAHQAVNSWMS